MMDSEYEYKYEEDDMEESAKGSRKKRGRRKRQDPAGSEARSTRFKKSSLLHRMQPVSGSLQAVAERIREAVNKYLDLFRQLYFEEFFLLFGGTFLVIWFLSNDFYGFWGMFLVLLWGLSVIIPIIAFFQEIPSRLLFRQAPLRIITGYAAGGFFIFLINQGMHFTYFSLFLFNFVLVTLFIEFHVQWNERNLLQATMNGEVLEWSSPRDATRKAIAEAGFTRDRVEKEVNERLKAEQLRTELITNISHDIRTPLTSIINFTELLKGEDLKPEARDYLLVVDKSANRMRIMVDDLFTATKTAAGHLKVTIETVDFSEVLMQTYAPLDNLFQEKGLELDYDRRDDTVALRADGTHLSRVIQNLLINAVKYSVRDTRVYVRVKEDNGSLRIRFTNISRQKLDITPEDLMEKFVRGDQSRQAEGSGLGLYIAQNLIEHLDGKLTLKIDGDAFTAELTLPKGIDEMIGEKLEKAIQ